MSGSLNYISVADLANYGLGSTAGSAAQYQTLSDAAGWAEDMFEELNGHTSFYAQTVTNEIPRNGWVDRHGWIELHAGQAAPVTAVSAVQYMIPGAVDSWTALGWDANNGILLPPLGAPPNPRAWAVRFNVGYYLPAPLATGDVYFRWSYTAGYSSTPSSLRMLLLRVAWWKYKLREAPLGKIASPPFGITEVIPGLPADFKADLEVWQYRLG